MRCGSPVIGMVMWLAILSGCEQKAATPTKTVATPPAKVGTVAFEEKLNTIVLTPEAVKRLGIETAAIELQEMRRIRAYGAELMLPGGALVIVSAPVTGTVKVPAGQQFPQTGLAVTKQQPLLELMPLLSAERAVLTPAERIRFAEARNSVAQSRIDAEGQVEQARVQVDAAQIALARAEQLLKDKVGTARAVDDAKAQLHLSQKTLSAAEARKKLVDGIDLETAETGSVKPLSIEAPLSGQVRTTLVREGEMVAAGAPLFEIVNTGQLWARVPVYVGDLDEIDAQQPAELTSLDGRYRGQTILAPPIETPPTATPLASAVDFYYAVENPDGKLRPGERLTAQLPLNGNAKQSTVPWSAVLHDIHGGQWVYEQQAERTFVRRRVEVAWVRENQAVLSRGPAVGTVVVTAGVAELAGTEFDFHK